jgi:hypothetical protein
MIKIETIPHENQRYDTIGDWQRLGDDVIIRVSNMNNELYEFLVGIHELIEMYLCEVYGITEKEVDAFDISHPEAIEPGNLPDAPYYRPHLIATIIERMLADELGVDWDKYEETIESV